jgi:hypothetical protein
MATLKAPPKIITTAISGMSLASVVNIGGPF